MSAILNFVTSNVQSNGYPEGFDSYGEFVDTSNIKIEIILLTK